MYYDFYGTSYQVNEHSYDKYCIIEHITADSILAWLLQNNITK